MLQKEEHIETIDASIKDYPCPACKSASEKAIWGKYDYIEAAQHFCSPSRNKDRNHRLREAIRNLWKQDYSYVLRCNDCGFAFGYPFVGGDETFYNILHEQFGYPSNRWEYDLTINEFFKEQPAEKVLDIGAGEGFFLDKVKGSEKYALEGSKTTREVLRKKEIKVYDTPENLILENEGTFNYVTMYQVLEHISEFEGVFKNASKLLKKGGYFVISVPDCDAMILQERLTGNADMIPNHINKWTPKSLEIALQPYGFEVKKIVYEPPMFKKFMNSVHLKILQQATHSNSIANSIYTINNRKARMLLLGLYSLVVAPSLLPHYNKLNQGGSFLLKAEKL